MRSATAAALAALLLAAGAGGMARPARAQAPADSVGAAPHGSPGAAPRDSVTTPAPASVAAPATSSAPASTPSDTAGARATARPRRGASVGPDLDRVELGGAAVQGYFSTVGTVAYRRFALERGLLQHWVMGELTGTKRVDLWEGTMSAYWLVRHRATYKPSWRLRPLLEAGPGLHLAVQAARIRGFSTTPFHARVFVKTHAYAGLEFLVSQRFGLLVRGRLTVPNHQPFDYAQAAIFLR